MKLVSGHYPEEQLKRPVRCRTCSPAPTTPWTRTCVMMAALVLLALVPEAAVGDEHTPDSSSWAARPALEPVAASDQDGGSYTGACPVEAEAGSYSALTIPTNLATCMSAAAPTSEYRLLANGGFLQLCLDHSFWNEQPPRNGRVGYICAKQGHYQSVYSFRSRASLYTAYRILPSERTPDRVLETHKSKRPRFQSIPDAVHSVSRDKSAHRDYAATITRGHLAYKGLFRRYGDASQATTRSEVNRRADETFMLANAAPQIEKFNGPVWSGMEEALTDVVDELRRQARLQAAYFATGVAYTDSALTYNPAAVESRVRAENPDTQLAAALAAAHKKVADTGAVVYRLDVQGRRGDTANKWSWDFSADGLPWPATFWTIVVIEHPADAGEDQSTSCMAVWGTNPYPPIDHNPSNRKKLPNVDPVGLQLRIGTLRELETHFDSGPRLGPVRIPSWLHARCELHPQRNDDLRASLRDQLPKRFKEVQGSSNKPCRPTSTVSATESGAVSALGSSTEAGCDARYVLQWTRKRR